MLVRVAITAAVRSPQSTGYLKGPKHGLTQKEVEFGFRLTKTEPRQMKGSRCWQDFFDVEILLTTLRTLKLAIIMREMLIVIF